MSATFSKAEPAAAMSRPLIHPGRPNEGVRSVLFISRQRRTGKTTCFRHDLIPALEQERAVVVIVDL
jgi:hypothetical protein